MSAAKFNLQNKSILVTGGTRGVGGAISLELARAGATVWANYVRDQKAAEQFLAGAEAEGLKIKGLRADLTADADLKKLIVAVSENGAKLDGFVHCAATGIHRPIEQLTTRHFDWTFSLNVRAFLALVVGLLPHFEKGASVVAISSEGAARAVTQYTLVGSSKGALESMARHMAAELAPRGIRVNTLAPGTVLTDAWKVLPESERRLEESIRKTPLGRLVTLGEVAAVARFLCSEAASGIVGQTIIVDGGARIVS
jgi:enoyl-[acyl-carrier protein] reductase III